MNPNFATLCAAVASEAAGHGYTVFMCSSAWSVDAEREIFRAMIERRFDGVVLLLADEAASDLRMLLDVGIPVVLVESQAQQPRRAVDSVLSDNFGGAREAGRYLIGLGHRRIGVLAGPQTVAPGRARLRRAVDAFFGGQARAQAHCFAQSVERVDLAIGHASHLQVEAVGAEVDRGQQVRARHARR